MTDGPFIALDQKSPRDQKWRKNFVRIFRGFLLDSSLVLHDRRSKFVFSTHETLCLST